VSAYAKPESWWHSPEFDAECRRRRAQQRVFFRRKAREQVADPEEISSQRRAETEARDRYFSREVKARRGDPRNALPRGNDLQAFADTFGVEPARLAQAEAMQGLGLVYKAKRLVFCGRVGRRLDCTGCPKRFFQPYMCRTRYCPICGPAWFRREFSDLLVALGPVVEHLLDEGRKRGREIVVAKIDFTVPNAGAMPKREFIRKFHSDLGRFWDRAEHRFGFSKSGYGVAGNDEFGGKKTEEHPLGNTNLHRHSVYVGPQLPQSKARKELSVLWSEIRGERSFVSIKRARSFAAALAHALKYPAKFLNASTPERLAQLEAVFHKTRRFSTGGAFYGIKVMQEPGEDSPVGTCPLCGAPLVKILEPWVPRFDLEAEGRVDVEEARRASNRAAAFSGEVRGP
jgi:hypothetical protein